MASTIKTQRCTIQDHAADMVPGGRRWVVTWTPSEGSHPIKFACATKHAARRLSEALDNQDVLWVTDD